METAFATHSDSRNASNCTGYSWKKYGHKVLASVNVKRFYYACAQKDSHGCPAKKIVDKPRKRPRAGSLNGRAASSGGGSDGAGAGGALSPEVSTASDNRKPASPNSRSIIGLSAASISPNDKLSGSPSQDLWARSSFPAPAGRAACAGHDQGSAGAAMAATRTDSAGDGPGGELSAETAMKEKTWFENAHNHPPPLLSARLSRNRFLAAASATAAAAAAAVPPPSPPPQGGMMVAPAASAGGGGVWRQQEQHQFLVQQQTPQLRSGRNGGQAEHLATFSALGNDTQALSMRSPPHQQAQQQQQVLMGRPMMPLDQSTLNSSGRHDASGGAAMTLGVKASVGGDVAYSQCGETHHALCSSQPQQCGIEAAQWPGSHAKRQSGNSKMDEGSGENRMPLLQMLSNQEPPPQLLLCTEPPLTPWDSVQPGNHASSPHNHPQHSLSRRQQQQQQQQQPQLQVTRQQQSQQQPQQQSHQWQQQGAAGRFHQPASPNLPRPPLPSHTTTTPPPLHTLNSGKRLKRDPGSSASLITMVTCNGSGPSMLSNILGHSNSSNAPTPAPAPAPALALAPALAFAAAPAPAARERTTTTPGEAQPTERNFIDALSLSPSSLSLSCSLGPLHGTRTDFPKEQRHTGDGLGLEARGLAGKGVMGKNNLKGEGLMGEALLGEGCAPAARGSSLNLPGFYEPSFPELSLSLGRL